MNKTGLKKIKNNKKNTKLLPSSGIRPDLNNSVKAETIKAG